MVLFVVPNGAAWCDGLITNISSCGSKHSSRFKTCRSLGLFEQLIVQSVMFDVLLIIRYILKTTYNTRDYDVDHL